MNSLREKTVVVLMFASGGAMLWGVRGAAGYGGTSGAVLPGLWWGLCAWAVAAERKEGAGWLVLACAFGYGFGGMHGYGQFMSWARGVFHINSAIGLTTAIDPAIGFLWWFLTGVGWGGFGGVMLAWALDGKQGRAVWLTRFTVLVAAGFLGSWFVRTFPQWVFPLYSPERYDLSVCVDCRRTLRTLPTQGSFVAMTLAALVLEAARGNRKGARTVLISSLGFGFAFLIANLNNVYNEGAIQGFDWWKVCEMTVGFIGGSAVGGAVLCHRASSPAWKVNAPGATMGERILGTNLALTLVLAWGAVQCTAPVWEHYLGLSEADSVERQLEWSVPLALIAAFTLFGISVRGIMKGKKRDGLVPLDGRLPLKQLGSLALMTAYGVLVTAKHSWNVSVVFVLLASVAASCSLAVTRMRDGERPRNVREGGGSLV